MTLYLISALVLAGIYAAWRLRRQGRIEAEHDQLAKLTETQRAQMEAAARAPVSKRELVDRLRSDGGL